MDCGFCLLLEMGEEVRGTGAHDSHHLLCTVDLTCKIYCTYLVSRGRYFMASSIPHQFTRVDTLLEIYPLVLRKSFSGVVLCI